MEGGLGQGGVPGTCGPAKAEAEQSLRWQPANGFKAVRTQSRERDAEPAYL